MARAYRIGRLAALTAFTVWIEWQVTAWRLDNQRPRCVQAMVGRLGQPSQEVAPLALDRDVRFVPIPALPNGPVAPLALPLPHGFMGQAEAPLEKQCRQVPSAQLVAEAPQDGQADDNSGLLEMVERVPVRSFHPRLQVRQRKQRWPHSVRSGRSAVAAD